MRAWAVSCGCRISSSVRLVVTISGLPAAVSAVHDVVDLFQCVFGATFHAEIVNDEQGLATEIVHNIVPPGKAAVQLVQDSGEVCHTHRHFLLHQSVRNAPGKESLAGANTAPEKQPKVL